MTVSRETLRSISRQEQLDDVVVWTTAPFRFRNELVPTNRLDEQRPARTAHRHGRPSQGSPSQAVLTDRRPEPDPTPHACYKKRR